MNNQLLLSYFIQQRQPLDLGPNGKKLPFVEEPQNSGDDKYKKTHVQGHHYHYLFGGTA